MQLEHILAAHGLIGRGGGKSKDEIPPPPITNFNATVVGNTIRLTWSNPIDSDFVGLLILGKNGSYPIGVNDGNIVLNKNIEDGGMIPTEVTDNKITLGARRYYRAFTYDFDKNYQTDTGQQTNEIVKISQTAPSAPTLASRTSTSINLNAISGCEYRIGSNAWQDSVAFSGLNLATSYTFYSRKKETETQYASPASEGSTFTTDKGAQTAPAAPTITNLEYDRVTVTGASGTEVRLGTGAWFDNPHTFTGLKEETSYSAYARMKETSTHYASAISSARGFTTPSACDDTTGSPGSCKLIAGTMQQGYFGTVPASELWTGTQLSSAVGISEGTIQFDDTPWLKFVLDGKILFRPMKAFRHFISWNTINSAGCVFGTKTVTKNGHTYKVRLMKGALTDPSLYDAPDRGAKGSEWNKLMLPIHIEAKNKSWAYPAYVEDDIPYWGIDFTDQDLHTHNSFGNGTYVWCQETRNTNSSRRVRRGDSGASYSHSTNATDSGSYYGWAPVLELI